MHASSGPAEGADHRRAGARRRSSTCAILRAPVSGPRVPLTRLRGVALRGGGLLAGVAGALVAAQVFDRDAVVSALGRVEPLWLAPLIAIAAAQLILRAARFRSLLPRPDHEVGSRLTWFLGVILVAQLVNNLTPARLGDGVKCYLVAKRRRLTFSHVLGTIMLEHTIDSASLAVVAALAALWLAVPDPFLTVSLVAGAVGLAVLVALFTADLPRIAARLRRAAQKQDPRPVRVGLPERVGSFLDGLSVAGRRRVVAAALATGLAIWVGDGLTFWLAGHALGLPIAPAAAMLIASAVALASVLPGAPGYVGTMEFAAVSAATAVGLGGPSALSLALLVHLVQFAPVTLAGLVAVVVGGQQAALVGRRPDAEPTSRPGPPRATALRGAPTACRRGIAGVTERA